MTKERIEEIHSKTKYPDSLSVRKALIKVFEECKKEQEQFYKDLEKVNSLEYMEIKKEAENAIKNQMQFMDQDKIYAHTSGFINGVEFIKKILCQYKK